MPILYSHYESGHCYKVALALSLIGAGFEQRPVDLNRLRELRGDDFREVARFDEVPVLVFDDGVAVCQSNAILEAIAERYGKLDGGTGEEKARVREWLYWEAGRIGINLTYVRLSRNFSKLPEPVEDWLDNRLRADLDRLDETLTGADFLVAGAPTIADIACCGYLFWPDQADLELDGWPAVQSWLRRLRALPGWQAPYDLLDVRYPILTGTRT